MSILGKTIGLFIGVVVLIFGIGFLFPTQIHVERATTIQAPPDAVFALISDLNTWDQWSPWAELDPEANMTITGAGLHNLKTVAEALSSPEPA